MERLTRHGGKTAVITAACLFGVFAAGVFFLRFDAEAVLGGEGNLRNNMDNPHNFSTLSNSSSVRASGTFKRVCVFCHTPHNAITDSSLINAPLWNHELSSVSWYTVKTSGQSIYNAAFSNTIYLNASPTNSPDGASRLCLSCHDGTVSVGAVRSIIGNITMDTSHTCLDGDGKILSSCSAYIRDLSTKHVVSVPMNAGLLAASAASCGGSNSVSLDYPWNQEAADTVLLRPTMEDYPDGSGNLGIDGGSISASKYRSGYNYGVQCSSCHDPHYWEPGGALVTAGQKFLVTDFNSLCSACHVDC